MTERETVGALAYKASHDSTTYNAYDIGDELNKDIAKHLELCAVKHRELFDMDEYCVCYVIASDPLIKNVMRRKFYAYPHLPSPRPNQTVFLYSKKENRFLKRLWSLPNAWSMACLSQMTYVAPEYREMKSWCDSFYKKSFWHDIREQHNITMLSEREYLKAHREEFIQAGCKDVEGLDAQAFDFSKIGAGQVVDTDKTSP